MKEEFIKKPTEICDECHAKFYINSSKMSNLCPNCSHYLYGYKNCNHLFKNGICVKCHWNGNLSVYLEKTLKK